MATAAAAEEEEEMEEEDGTAPRPAREGGAPPLLPRRTTVAVHHLETTEAGIGKAAAVVLGIDLAHTPVMGAVVELEAIDHDLTRDLGARGRDRGVFRAGRGVGVRHGGAMEVVVVVRMEEEEGEEGTGDGRLSRRDGEQGAGGGGARVIRAIVAIASVAGVGAGGDMEGGGEKSCTLWKGVRTLGEGVNVWRVCKAGSVEEGFDTSSSFRQGKFEKLRDISLGQERPSRCYNSKPMY